jgi:ubiquinone/menaquinone biosynthesis C-methylase UbiE
MVCDTTGLPFQNKRFDTVVMLACLNHVPQSKRSEVLQEARRVLKDDGQLLITMINPVVGVVVHAIRRRYDLDQLERGIGHEEAKGLWDKAVRELLAKTRLRHTATIPFVFGLNRLYVVEKDGAGDN